MIYWDNARVTSGHFKTLFEVGESLMQNSFSIVNFFQVLFVVFVKSSADKMSQDKFFDFFNANFPKVRKESFLKSFFRYIKAEAKPRYKLIGELKEELSNLLEKISENNIEKDENYNNCLEDFKDSYIEKILDHKSSSTRKEEPKLVLKIIYSIIKNDASYQFLIDDLSNFCNSSEYNEEETIPYLFDIFLIALTNENYSDDTKKENKKMLEKIENLHKSYSNPKKIEDSMDRLLPALTCQRFNFVKFEKEAEEELQKYGIENYFICSLGREHQTFAQLESSYNKSYSAIFTPDKITIFIRLVINLDGNKIGIVCWDTLLSNKEANSLYKFTLNEIEIVCWDTSLSNKEANLLYDSIKIEIVYQNISLSDKETDTLHGFIFSKFVANIPEHKWLLRSRDHDYVLGYEIKENCPVLYKKQVDTGYKPINNIEWNGVDISNTDLDIKFSAEEIDEPRYLFILDKKRSKFYYCYLKAENQLKVMHIPILGKVKKYSVYTNNELQKSPVEGALPPDWTCIVISSTHYGLSCQVHLNFPPDGSIDISEK